LRKNILILCMAFLFQGCVSASIPHYLKDDFPYKKEFLAGYSDTLRATEQALKELGWKIGQTSKPAVYEQDSVSQQDADQEVLIFTSIRQTAMFLGTRYSKMNIYVRKVSQGTEVEIRYITVTSTIFKAFENYQNEGAAKKVLEHIEKALQLNP